MNTAVTVHTPRQGWLGSVTAIQTPDITRLSTRFRNASCTDAPYLEIPCTGSGPIIAQISFPSEYRLTVFDGYVRPIRVGPFGSPGSNGPLGDPGVVTLHARKVTGAVETLPILPLNARADRSNWTKGSPRVGPCRALNSSE